METIDLSVIKHMLDMLDMLGRAMEPPVTTLAALCVTSVEKRARLYR